MSDIENSSVESVEQPVEGKIKITSNDEKDIEYTFTGYGLGVNVHTLDEPLVIEQGKHTESFEEGTLVGSIHFAPFGKDENPFRLVVDSSGKVQRQSVLPQAPILTKGLLGLRAFFADLDKADLPEPKIVHSKTNLRMAEFSVSLGFDIPGFVTHDMTKEEKREGIAKLRAVKTRNIVVTTDFSRLRNNIRNENLLGKLEAKMLRLYGDDLQAVPAGLTSHPLSK